MVGGGTYMPLTPTHLFILLSITAVNNIAKLCQRMPEMPQMRQVRQLAVGRHG